jgi:hypothetical protein
MVSRFTAERVHCPIGFSDLEQRENAMLPVGTSVPVSDPINPHRGCCEQVERVNFLGGRELLKVST